MEDLLVTHSHGNCDVRPVCLLENQSLELTDPAQILHWNDTNVLWNTDYCHFHLSSCALPQCKGLIDDVWYKAASVRGWKIRIDYQHSSMPIYVSLQHILTCLHLKPYALCFPSAMGYVSQNNPKPSWGHCLSHQVLTMSLMLATLMRAPPPKKKKINAVALGNVHAANVLCCDKKNDCHLR